jgi:hypothetical protein
MSENTDTNSDYGLITPARPCSALDTRSLFDNAYVEDNESPIDQFLRNTKVLNILAERMEADEHLLTSLVFLGYLSAVESYVRTLARRLIFIDEHARWLVEKKTLSFGAAWHHENEYLPEALFENMSFSDTSELKKVFSEYLGINIDTNEISALLKQYRNLCELRHCSVHRFGILGTKNAIGLGLDAHSSLLGKPVLIGKAELQSIGEVLLALVKTLNNIAYASVLKRTADHTNAAASRRDPKHRYSTVWSWHRAKDRKRFATYYNLFSSREDATPSKSVEEMYELFRSGHRPKKQD